MTTETTKRALLMPVAFFLRWLAIAYGQNQPPRSGDRIRVDLRGRPTNAADRRQQAVFHPAGKAATDLEWLAEGIDRVVRKGLDDPGTLDEADRRLLMEFFWGRHVPARDPEQLGLPLMDLDAPSSDSPLDALLAAEAAAERRDLLEALRRLAPPREQAVLDAIKEGATDQEIATRLRVSPATIRVLKHRLRRKIAFP